MFGEKGGKYFSSYVSPNIFPFLPKYYSVTSAIHLYKELILGYD
jgi:hypothetical protein